MCVCVCVERERVCVCVCVCACGVLVVCLPIVLIDCLTSISCVFLNKTISFSGVRVQVAQLEGAKGTVSSGVITEHTRFVFRSKSARVLLLVQMSQEMWEYCADGDLYFEKAVRLILSSQKLFSKQKTCSQQSLLLSFFLFNLP